MSNIIPVFHPEIDSATIKAAVDALDLGWLGMGSYVKEFETRLGEVLELPPDRVVVAVNTCTSALHLALLNAGVMPGHEVLTPALNNIGDFQAIGMCGARPVFVDIDEHNLAINPDLIEPLVTSKTKAIIALHYMGIPCAIDKVYAVAKRHGLTVIEDCAHALASRSSHGILGSFGDIACFSFDAIKTVTCIDGGAIVLPRAYASNVYPQRLLGMTQPNDRLYSNARAYDFDVLDQGFRYHLANLHASIGLSQLSALPRFIENRRKYARLYNEAFREMHSIRTPTSNFEGVSLFHYVVRVVGRSRNEFRDHLRQRGVDTGVHWLPGHWFTWLKQCRGATQLPVTDRVGSEIVTLPLWSTMPDDVISRVVEAVRSFESRPFARVAQRVVDGRDQLRSVKQRSTRLEIAGFANTYLRSVITANPAGDDVAMLTRWRNANKRSFLTEFEATETRTQKWLVESVDRDDTRVLFMIDGDQGAVGYIGLAAIDWDKRTVEADSVVRGVASYPGLMSAALKALLSWARCMCGLKHVAVRVLADNAALRFYERFGFREVERIGLVPVTTDDGTVWSPVSDQKDADRLLVQMALEDE